MQYLSHPLFHGLQVPVFVFFAFAHHPIGEIGIEIVDFDHLIRNTIIGDRQVDGERMQIGSHVVRRTDGFPVLVRWTLVVIAAERIGIGQRRGRIIGQMDFLADGAAHEPFVAHADKRIVERLLRYFVQ